jgi:hypothetical protein
VKFLIDNDLSPLLADGMRVVVHNAVHFRDLKIWVVRPTPRRSNMHDPRSVYLLRRISTSCFACRSQAVSPSVILIRPLNSRTPARIVLRSRHLRGVSSVTVAVQLIRFVALMDLDRILAKWPRIAAGGRAFRRLQLGYGTP